MLDGTKLINRHVNHGKVTLQTTQSRHAKNGLDFMDTITAISNYLTSVGYFKNAKRQNSPKCPTVSAVVIENGYGFVNAQATSEEQEKKWID